ncbi:hypothetical protein Tco_0049732 [Tanacetum coccineum]
MKVEESLNVTFDETPPPSKTSHLEDDDLVKEEAIEVSKTRPLGKFLESFRVGSIEHFENPLDTKKLESSSYHALGACLSPYKAFLRW